MRNGLAVGIAFALGFGMAPSAMAQAFEPPQGCDAHLTVQYRGCLMNNIWICPADTPGDKWMALFNDAGLYRIRRVDENFQWLETYFIAFDLKEIMDPEPVDPASLDMLFSSNRDTYDFVVRQEGSFAREPRRFVGYDQLTGAETVIDGERLLNTQYAYSVKDEDGQVLQQRVGRQFVHPEERIFLFGQSSDADGTNANDNSPAEFIRPGEPGFFATRPRYDCDVMMSSWEDAQ